MLMTLLNSYSSTRGDDHDVVEHDGIKKKGGIKVIIIIIITCWEGLIDSDYSQIYFRFCVINQFHSKKFSLPSLGHGHWLHTMHFSFQSMQIYTISSTKFIARCRFCCYTHIRYYHVKVLCIWKAFSH